MHLWITLWMRFFAPVIQNPAFLIAPSVNRRPWCLTRSWKCLVIRRAMWLFPGMIIGCFSLCSMGACSSLPPTLRSPSWSMKGFRVLNLLVFGRSFPARKTSKLNRVAFPLDTLYVTTSACESSSVSVLSQRCHFLHAFTTSVLSLNECIMWIKLDIARLRHFQSKSRSKRCEPRQTGKSIGCQVSTIRTHFYIWIRVNQDVWLIVFKTFWIRMRKKGRPRNPCGVFQVWSRYWTSCMIGRVLTCGNIMPLFRPCRFPDPLNSITHVHIKPSGFVMNIPQHHFTVRIEFHKIWGNI